MTQKNRTRDMTVGAPMKLILSFAAPLLFGFLGQALGMGLFAYFLLFFYVFLVTGVFLNRRQFKIGLKP